MTCANAHDYRLSGNVPTRVDTGQPTPCFTRIPATPNIYDIIWNYEEGVLWFFSNLKSANEELETLFTRSFKLSLIRMFPYTAGLNAGLSGPDKDCLDQLKPTLFME